ncbi:MAG: aminotransferase class I/II-fold pyridoxal phosphate-dependent enzyme [Candidatus Lokiarchaeota archaeon]|nr:aminotransferase class I/II-fold pyridoxal phosphate-dependent enzyme [Candidatus Lokiarchaeota archaeon]MBD3200481.1 aminotransferase class I/II-fold pyridoxal phosphate-dependent enzyme [Candidatus Lokiarchaeota archaeon]
MKELSKVLKHKTPKSKIRELFDLASGRSDVISLGIGQPDFNTPKPAIDGNIEALKKNITQYAPTRGVPELLQQIEDKLRTENGVETNWNENIIVTNGGSQALTLTFASIFNPGDELILFSPNFISYYYLAPFFGVKPIEIPRKRDFSPDLELLKESITPKTKAILINSPNNPTGYAYSHEEIEFIAQIVKENDLYLISDEVYENYYYDGRTHKSPASLKEMFPRTITLNAMSKLFSATGFRLGYIAARKDIINLMEKYHQYTVAGTNHAAQYGFIEALKMDKSFFDPILKSFTERRDLVYKRLKEIGFEVVKPKGAFYIMPSLKNFNLISQDFSERIIKEKGVAIVPGNIFGSYSDDRLRISYATEINKLREAMDRIEGFIRDL